MAEVKIIAPDEKLKVGYCIPLWLRDEQIRLNTARCPGRLAVVEEPRTEPIACVSYGPSLNDTWEQIRNFKYVMSCSGAHRFLIDRGIVPTWHIDVDPRPHKIKLIGEPHPDVEYLIASTCSPELFDYLRNHKVQLWHVFDNSEEGLRMLPPDDWAVCGGCSVGLRTLTLAAILGFKELHVFGMDGSEGKTGKHAAAHPNQPKSHCLTHYHGVEYRTTPAMLAAARETWHELDNLKGVTATFYGEGLVQAMAKDYVRKPPVGSVFIGMQKPRLITDAYARLNRQLHESNLTYGVGGGKHAETVKTLYRTLTKKNDFVSVLDYGCGKGYLAKALPFTIAEYDPAMPGKTEPPRAADLVICTDVLEHIERECIGAVLKDLQRCVKQIGYFTIHTGPAMKTLPDGRNTHLIQKDKTWWKKHLEKYFTIGTIIQKGPELYVVVAPKPKKAKTQLKTEVSHVDRNGNQAESGAGSGDRKPEPVAR